MMTTDALATRDPRTDVAAFEPGDLPQALALATTLLKSRMLPTSYTTPEAVVAAVITGRELGLSTMQSIRGIHVINGKPTLASATLVALCLRRSDLCEYLTPIESTAQSCTYAAKRKGAPEAKFTFTIADAKAAGLTGNPTWTKFPAAMLLARAGAMAARAIFPDLVAGIYDPDELTTYDEPPPAPAAAPRTRKASAPAPVAAPVEAPREVVAVAALSPDDDGRDPEPVAPAAPPAAHPAPSPACVEFLAAIASAESSDDMIAIAKRLSPDAGNTDERLGLLLGERAKIKAAYLPAKAALVAGGK